MLGDCCDQRPFHKGRGIYRAYGGSRPAGHPGHTVEADRLDITVRWCSEIAVVNSKGYRILLGGRIYNILSIDEMGFKRNSRKFHAELSER